MSTKYAKLYSLLSTYIYLTAAFIAPALLEAQNTPNILIIVCDDLNDSIAGMGGIRKRRRQTSTAWLRAVSPS